MIKRGWRVVCKNYKGREMFRLFLECGGIVVGSTGIEIVKNSVVYRRSSNCFKWVKKVGR